MKRFAYLLLFEFALGNFQSCSPQNKKESQEDVAAKNRILNDSIKKRELNLLCQAENAMLEFNDADYQLTIHYELLLEENKRVVIHDFWIRDIRKNNEYYDVTIQSGSISIKIITFKCTANQLELICPEIYNTNNFIFFVENRYLVIEIESIKKLEFQFEPYDGIGILYGSIGDPAIFQCTGKLLNFR